MLSGPLSQVRAGGRAEHDDALAHAAHRIKSPFSGPLFVLALAEIHLRVVQINAVEKSGLRRFEQKAALSAMTLLPMLLTDQIVFFTYLDVYHKSPDSGERQYKSM